MPGVVLLPRRQEVVRDTPHPADLMAVTPCFEKLPPVGQGGRCGI